MTSKTITNPPKEVDNKKLIAKSIIWVCLGLIYVGCVDVTSDLVYYQSIKYVGAWAVICILAFCGWIFFNPFLEHELKNS